MFNLEKKLKKTNIFFLQASYLKLSLFGLWHLCNDLAYPSTFELIYWSVQKTLERCQTHFQILARNQEHKNQIHKTGKGLQVFSDADWGGEWTDFKSFSGYVISLVDAPVSWSSKKQLVITLSSTETEYVAIYHVTKEMFWMNNLLKKICVSLTSIPQDICIDNQGAIFLTRNCVTSERSKHIDIKYYFLCDLVNQNTKFLHVKSKDNVANMFTKR